MLGVPPSGVLSANTLGDSGLMIHEVRRCGISPSSMSVELLPSEIGATILVILSLSCVVVLPSITKKQEDSRNTRSATSMDL